jgi:hypothetical protein
MMVEFVCDAESMAVGVRHWCSHYLFADECLKRIACTETIHFEIQNVCAPNCYRGEKWESVTEWYTSQSPKRV